MRLEKLDPGAQVAYQTYLSRADDPARTPAISVVLTYDGDLDVLAAGFEAAWSGPGEVVGTLRWSDLEAVTELPGVRRIAAGLRRVRHLDTATAEVRARASTVANIGADGLCRQSPAESAPGNFRHRPSGS